MGPTHGQMIDGAVLHHFVTHERPNSTQPKTMVVTEIERGSRARKVVATVTNRGLGDPGTDYKPSFQHMTTGKRRLIPVGAFADVGRGFRHAHSCTLSRHHRLIHTQFMINALHDCAASAVTAQFHVMLEAPCYYPEVTTPVGKVDWTGWTSDLDAGTRVRLVDRVTGESRVWKLSRNLFSIHHINAYLDSATNSVVLDVIETFPSFIGCDEAFKSLTVNYTINSWRENALAAKLARPQRLKIPLDQPNATVEPVTIGDVTGVCRVGGCGWVGRTQSLPMSPSSTRLTP